MTEAEAIELAANCIWVLVQFWLLRMIIQLIKEHF